MSHPATDCPWPGEDPLYRRYHDEEWGVPRTSDRDLFEKLVLEGFQAGLSWITILRKREHFRNVFDGFDPERIARYTPAKLAALEADPGIVRNRLKIAATVDNARAFLSLAERGVNLSRLLWNHVLEQPPRPAIVAMSEVPASTPTSIAISKSLKKNGFRFVGPTTVYALMQSCGLVNDHLASCRRHGPCGELQAAVVSRMLDARSPASPE